MIFFERERGMSQTMSNAVIPLFLFPILHLLQLPFSSQVERKIAVVVSNDKFHLSEDQSR